MILKVSRIIRNKLFTLGRVRRYSQDSVIIKEGEKLRAALFLISGEVQPSLPTSPLFLISFLEGSTAPKDLITKVPTEVLMVPREKFIELMKGSAELACLIIEELLKESKEKSLIDEVEN